MTCCYCFDPRHADLSAGVPHLARPDHRLARRHAGRRAHLPRRRGAAGRGAARGRTRVQCLHRPLPVHRWPVRNAGRRQDQPAAGLADTGDRAPAGRVRTRRVLPARCARLRDRTAPFPVSRPVAAGRDRCAGRRTANRRRAGDGLHLHVRLDRHARAAPQDVGRAGRGRARVGRSPRAARCARLHTGGHGAAAAHVRLRIDGAVGAGRRARLQQPAAVLSGRHPRGTRGGAAAARAGDVARPSACAAVVGPCPAAGVAGAVGNRAAGRTPGARSRNAARGAADRDLRQHRNGPDRHAPHCARRRLAPAAGHPARSPRRHGR